MKKSDVILEARRLNFVQETDGPNRGPWVELFQRLSKGIPGDSWCADFVSFVLDVAYYGLSPLYPTGSTITLLHQASLKKMIIPSPILGDIFFFTNDVGTPHHVGFVTSLNPLVGIAGNTSPDGMSPNGTGVFEHELLVKPSNIVFVRLP